MKKVALDPFRPYAATCEEELDATGSLAPTAVVFLTNKQCPFECVMCDLWVHTLDQPVPVGAIPAQIQHALARLTPQHGATQIKLYNAGSFFDPAAIPASDDLSIARLLDRFDRVIVEAHPAFLAGAHGERCLRFRDAIRGRLEVAIGLEAADDRVLARLNKRMTLDGFRRAAEFLKENDVDLRAFILLNPPFVDDADAIDLACRSIDFARANAAIVCSVIPTRSGNDTMPPDFRSPRLPSLERVMEYAIANDHASRVFADLWDVHRFFTCACSAARAARLAEMNHTQRVPPPVACPHGC